MSLLLRDETSRVWKLSDMFFGVLVTTCLSRLSVSMVSSGNCASPPSVLMGSAASDAPSSLSGLPPSSAGGMISVRSCGSTLLSWSGVPFSQTETLMMGVSWEWSSGCVRLSGVAASLFVLGVRQEGKVTISH